MTILTRRGFLLAASAGLATLALPSFAAHSRTAAALGTAISEVPTWAWSCGQRIAVPPVPRWSTITSR